MAMWYMQREQLMSQDVLVKHDQHSINPNLDRDTGKMDLSAFISIERVDRRAGPSLKTTLKICETTHASHPQPKPL